MSVCIFIFFSSDGHPILYEYEAQELQSADQQQDPQLLSIEPVFNTNAGNVDTFELDVESPHTVEQTTSSFECENGLKTKQRSTLQLQKENEIPHDAYVIEPHSSDRAQQQ